MQEYSYLFAFCKIYQYGIIKNRFKILFEFFAHWMYVYRIAQQLSNQILKFSLNWNTQTVGILGYFDLCHWNQPGINIKVEGRKNRILD